MKESGMRQIVVRALQGLDAIAVENPAQPGTPDVNYIEGWIELKILEDWPKREGTPVRVECFTAQQRVWLSQRCRRGGRAFFLIKVSRDWLLFDGDYASKHIGKMTREEMLLSCLLHCTPSLRKNDLQRVLKTWRRENSH